MQQLGPDGIVQVEWASELLTYSVHRCGEALFLKTKDGASLWLEKTLRQHTPRYHTLRFASVAQLKFYKFELPLDCQHFWWELRLVQDTFSLDDSATTWAGSPQKYLLDKWPRLEKLRISLKLAKDHLVKATRKEVATTGSSRRLEEHSCSSSMLVAIVAQQGGSHHRTSAAKRDRVNSFLVGLFRSLGSFWLYLLPVDDEDDRLEINCDGDIAEFLVVAQSQVDRCRHVVSSCAGTDLGSAVSLAHLLVQCIHLKSCFWVVEQCVPQLGRLIDSFLLGLPMLSDAASSSTSLGKRKRADRDVADACALAKTDIADDCTQGRGRVALRNRRNLHRCLLKYLFASRRACFDARVVHISLDASRVADRDLLRAIVCVPDAGGLQAMVAPPQVTPS